MRIDRIGLAAPEGSERAQRGQERGEVFHVDRPPGAESPADGEQGAFYAERIGQGRRRVMVQRGRRAGDVNGRQHVAEEPTTRAQAELHGSLDLDPGEGGGPGEGGEVAGGDAAAEGARADFAALTTHLTGLSGAVREVTLYLPSLGQVTARLEAGAISVTARVPRRLVDAVRRAEGELQERMAQAGLRISQLQIIPQDDPPAQQQARERRPAPRDGLRLVDVMA
jgi:hypothetical protein